jgi:hypothetical protein
MSENVTETSRRLIFVSQEMPSSLRGRTGGIVATRFSQYRTPEAASLEQRAEPHLKLSLTHASARRYGKAAIDALLHDLSIYGCRMAAKTRAAAGERLWLSFENRSPVSATIVWNNDGMIGCRFDTPIERAMLRSISLRLA